MVVHLEVQTRVWVVAKIAEPEGADADGSNDGGTLGYLLDTAL